jgi:hypothetical protein|tara:strand:+ start:192 stop:560 length:369 start_codon:yes stop_codon:yes gene_type:complete
MTHFAQINVGIVIKVIVAEQDFIDAQPGEWVQTSYNTRGGKHYAPNSNTEDDGVALNKNHAGPGFSYVDGVGFHAPQPYPSWTLDSGTYWWEPPVARPDDGKRYEWNEELHQENNSLGWVEV